MSRYVSVEVDICIDDYVSEISFETLVEELVTRTAKNPQEEKKQKEIMMDYFETEDLLELICRVKNLNILQASQLSDFINKELTI